MSKKIYSSIAQDIHNRNNNPIYIRDEIVKMLHAHPFASNSEMLKSVLEFMQYFSTKFNEENQRELNRNYSKIPRIENPNY